MRRLLAVAFAIATAALVGCKQQEGERCERDSDCASGLTCSLNKPGKCIGVVINADAFMPDANVDASDASVVPDSGTSDAPVDASVPDALPDA
jgi:hypothetical protein